MYTGEKVAIKLEDKKIRYPQVSFEAQILKHLQGGRSILITQSGSHCRTGVARKETTLAWSWNCLARLWLIIRRFVEENSL